MRVSEPLPESALVEMELRSLDTGSTWSWRFKGARAFDLRHPEGELTLVARAEGYRPAENRLTRVSTGEAAPLYLYRLPVLTGSVVDAKTATPLVQAEVTAGEASDTTDAKGRFRLVIDGEWPSLLRVSVPNRAPKIVIVPKAIANADLGDVRIFAGGTVRFKIAPIDGNDAAITWELCRLVSTTRCEDSRQEKVTAGATEHSIEGLDPGDYRLTIRGERPFQQFAIPIGVVDGTTSDHTIAIEPSTLDIEARFDSKPLDEATVQLYHESGWSGKVTTDAEGRASERIWQPGRYTAGVSRKPTVKVWSDSKEIGDDTRIYWLLDVPNRTIRGRVTDAKTSLPISDAQVILESTHVGTKNVSSGATLSDGSFEFGAVPEGMHRLQVRKTGYSSKQQWQFQLGATDTRYETDLAVEPLEHNRRVIVLNSRDVPVSSAAVYLAQRTGVREIGETDASGRIDLHLSSPEERGVLFVVPRTGSLSFLRIVPPAQDRPDDPVTIRVPDGSASLELNTRSTTGEPIAGVSVVIRYNGMILPSMVLQGLMLYQGAPLRSDQSGRLFYPRLPTGQFEIWPIGSREDYDLVFSPAGPPPAPVVLAVAEGQNTALLKFREKN